MPALEVFSNDEFPASLNWQAVSFMRVEWPSILLSGHRLGTETYPAAHQPVHFSVSEQGVLISYAAVMWLSLSHGGSSYRVAAFGNVFTYPAFRREGYGRQLVREALAYIDRSDADVAIMFCEPHLVRFYLPCGWESMPGAGTRIGTPAAYSPHPLHRLMRFVSQHGERHRASFAAQPLYIDWPW